MSKKILPFFIIVLTFSCEDLIEVEDISNETINVLAPTNNSILDTVNVSFSWQPLDYAESYELQIALPDFNAAQVIVEDTIVSYTSFIKTLDAANYQWRVKAINFAYETQYTTQNLTIEE